MCTSMVIQLCQEIFIIKVNTLYLENLNHAKNIPVVLTSSLILILSLIGSVVRDLMIKQTELLVYIIDIQQLFCKESFFNVTFHRQHFLG